MAVVPDCGAYPFVKGSDWKNGLEYALENNAFSESGVLVRMREVIREAG